MSLIKIFPSFSPDTERNIQADIIGKIYGLNIWLSKADKGVYLEIILAGGSLYERVTSICNEPYDLNEELIKIKKQISAAYPDEQSIKDQQIKFYSDLWAQMVKGELDKNRAFLVSYVKFCIIFGADYLPQDEFNHVLLNLKEKRTAQIEREQEEKAARNKIAEEKRIKEREVFVQSIKARVINDESIDGGTLVDFCKDYGIEMHIRTQGTIRQKVSEVNSGSYRHRRGTIFKIGPSHYYKVLRELLVDEKAKRERGELYEETKKNLKHLFGETV
jgi:hypothetical protein